MSEVDLRPPGSMPPRYLPDRPNLYCALAALVVLVCFLPGLQNGFVQWDDNLFIYQNPNITKIDLQFWAWVVRPFHGNWTPLPLLSHALDYALYGLNPAGHHLTSIIFHAVNTFLVGRLFWELLMAANWQLPRSGQDNFATIGAVVGALFFGLSPLRVESVVWVSERRDVLFLFFGLISIHCYLRYCLPRRPGARPNHGKLYYRLSLASFACGLLSKSMLVTLPLVLLILDYYPLGRFELATSIRGRLALVKEKVPYLLLSAMVALMTVLAQRTAGAVYTLAEVPPLNRIGSACYAAIFYISKSVWPADLAPLYVMDHLHSPLPWHYLLAMALVMVMSTVVALLARHSRLYAAAWMYFLLTMLPISGLLQTGNQFAADRYTYFPGLAFALLFGVLVGELLTSPGKYPKVMRYLTLCLAGGYMLLTVFLLQNQIKVWRDTISLWSQEIKLYDGIAVSEIYNRRGAAYFNNGQLPQAIEDFSKAIQVDRNNPTAHLYRAIAYLKNNEQQKAVADLLIAARFGNRRAQDLLIGYRITGGAKGAGQLAPPVNQPAGDLSAP